MKDSRIFITGGAGFIGANLVKCFLDKDRCEITVYDNLSVGSKENLDKAISDSKQKVAVKFIKGDILDRRLLEKETKNHNVIIHLAAHTRVIESLKNPEENININSTGTFNVLEAARKNRIKKFMFASSNAAVGEQIPPVNEKMIPKPISPYGASKLFGEALCSAYFNSFRLKTVSLRFANVYGAYSEHKTSVIAKFIKRAKQRKSLEIYGDGNQTRDFIHVSDICQAIYLSLSPYISNSSPWGEIYQIATGVETKIIDLAKMVKSLAGKSGFKSSEIVFKGARRGDLRKNYSDISKAKQVLSFRPKIKLSEGINETIDWFLEY